VRHALEKYPVSFFRRRVELVEPRRHLGEEDVDDLLEKSAIAARAREGGCFVEANADLRSRFFRNRNLRHAFARRVIRELGRRQHLAERVEELLERDRLRHVAIVPRFEAAIAIVGSPPG
jgi:hypothetical protein